MGATRKWRPRLEEVNREVRQSRDAVPREVEHGGLRGTRQLIMLDITHADSQASKVTLAWRQR